MNRRALSASLPLSLSLSLLFSSLLSLSPPPPPPLISTLILRSWKHLLIQKFHSFEVPSWLITAWDLLNLSFLYCFSEGCDPISSNSRSRSAKSWSIEAVSEAAQDSCEIRDAGTDKMIHVRDVQWSVHHTTITFITPKYAKIGSARIYVHDDSMRLECANCWTQENCNAWGNHKVVNYITEAIDLQGCMGHFLLPAVRKERSDNTVHTEWFLSLKRGERTRGANHQWSCEWLDMIWFHLTFEAVALFETKLYDTV